MNIRRAEDGLQVHPVFLHVEPFIQGLTEQTQLSLRPLRLSRMPLTNRELMMVLIVTIESSSAVMISSIPPRMNVSRTSLYAIDLETHVRPLVRHLLEELLKRLFLSRFGGDGADGLAVRGRLEVENLL